MLSPGSVFTSSCGRLDTDRSGIAESEALRFGTEEIETSVVPTDSTGTGTDWSNSRGLGLGSFFAWAPGDAIAPAMAMQQTMAR